jgi:hypothetical protein
VIAELPDSGLGARELRVHRALLDISPKLAGMYQRTIQEVQSHGDLHIAAARVSIICHCMREVMNALPALLADSATVRPNPSSATLVNQLPELLASHPIPNPRPTDELTPVPQALLSAIRAIADAAAKESNANTSNAMALISSYHDAPHPVIQQWRSAQHFFLEWTHLDRNPSAERTLPSDSVLLNNIRVVEDVIEVRTNLFFENLRVVQDLLDIANGEGR